MHHGASATSKKLLLVSLEWESSLQPFKRSTLTEQEEQRIAQFECRKAECFKPADRAYVLNSIRENWGSENDFDEFVRSKLKRILELNRERYNASVATVASEAFALIFGD